jgi:hypothetical protein
LKFRGLNWSQVLNLRGGLMKNLGLKLRKSGRMMFRGRFLLCGLSLGLIPFRIRGRFRIQIRVLTRIQILKK